MAHVETHLSIDALRAGWRLSGEATEARHYQTIWHLAAGRTITETATVTGFVPRWIEALFARYNAFGPQALGDQRRGNGSKPKLLTPKVLSRLKERLMSAPEDGGVWTSKKAAAFIAAELGLAGVATQRGWEALRAVGYTIQKPRPRHAGVATDKEQAVFKKTSPKPSRKNRPRTPRRSSRPSPPTSTASVSYWRPSGLTHPAPPSGRPREYP